MLLSPRNLARGYRWTDALSHEYIHYIVVQLSYNRAPIWLHEGIAKYFESAWRLPQVAWLDRRSESLLAHAVGIEKNHYCAVNASGSRHAVRWQWGGRMRECC